MPKPARGKTIYRVACRHKPYAQLGNAMIRDNRLTFEARGVLAYILSFPSNWQFGQEWLCKKTGLGRDRSYRIVKELCTHGYCFRQQERRPDGTLGPYEYVFTDEPGAIASDPGEGTQDVGGGGEAGDADTQGHAPPLPEKPEAAEPEAAEPDTAKAEAAYKKDPNTISNEDPPKVPQQAGGRRPRATYLPDDWTLPNADRAWTVQYAPRLKDRIGAEVEAFRDWHSGKRRSDWSARWRTWCRNAKRAGGIVVGHADRGLGIRNPEEPFEVYRDRMIREGKYRPAAAEVRP